MKIVAFCGSARKNGNTVKMLETLLGPLIAAGAETGLVQLAGQKIGGCKACYGCFKTKDNLWIELLEHWDRTGKGRGGR